MSIFRDPDAPRTPPFALTLDRRRFLAGTGALAASAAFGDLAAAQAGERIVVADPGGPFGVAFKVAFHDSFKADTGITSVQIAREHEPTAQVATMVKTRNYTWDVVTLTLSARDILHKQDLLEPLDWSLPDMNEIMPEARHPAWMGTDVYCTILAYRSDKFPGGGPQSWRDYFDLAKFPGRRAMRRSPIDTLEIALLADGVEPAKLYPLDVDRAFKKLDQIKKHIAVWWTGGAQTTQLLQSGEVDMVPTWNARAQTVTDAGGPVKITWNQGLYSIEGWGIAKGNPKAGIAKRFVAYTANAKRQAAFTKHLAYGPTNPGAYKYIDAATAAKLPTAPDIFPKIILAKEEWWAAHRQKSEERFTAWMLS
jgi:putative spermidine/putrescine transport system substrate-binding protein